MSKLAELYNIAEKEGIKIETWDFPKCISGLYVKLPQSPPTIGLNKNIINNTKLHTCVLAEEVGHYYTTAGDCVSPCYSYNDRVVLNKKERLAMKWAVNFLMPIKELVKAARESIDQEEISDKLSVTYKFLNYGLKLYSKTYPYLKLSKNDYLVLQNYPNVYVFQRFD